MADEGFVFQDKESLIKRKVGIAFLEKTKKGDPKINIIIDKLKGLDKLRLFALESKKNLSQFVIYRYDNKDELFRENDNFQKASFQKAPS